MSGSIDIVSPSQPKGPDAVYAAILAGGHPLSGMLNFPQSRELTLAMVRAAAVFHQLDPQESKPFEEWFNWFASQSITERKLTLEQMKWWIGDALSTGVLRGLDDDYRCSLRLFIDSFAEFQRAVAQAI